MDVEGKAGGARELEGVPRVGPVQPAEVAEDVDGANQCDLIGDARPAGGIDDVPEDAEIDVVALHLNPVILAARHVVVGNIGIIDRSVSPAFDRVSDAIAETSADDVVLEDERADRIRGGVDINGGARLVPGVARDVEIRETRRIEFVGEHIDVMCVVADRDASVVVAAAGRDILVVNILDPDVVASALDIDGVVV